MFKQMLAELTARSCFSLLDGASQPDALVRAAVERGYRHLGLVDRDGVYGAALAHSAARSAGLHLVHGATVTVEDGAAIVLLVRDARGWSNLCRNLTDARARAPKGRALLPVDRLCAHADGLSILLRRGWTAASAAPLRAAFGDLGVLLGLDLAPADGRRTRTALALATALGAPVVAGNDVRFVDPAERPVHDVLCCIRRRTTLAAAGRALLANRERSLLYAHELRARYAAVPGALEASLALAERCAFSLGDLRYGYPREVVPDGWTPMTWLAERTRQGLAERYPEGVPETVRQQAAHELGVIEELDFPSYFLTVDDVVRFARGRGILCQGRGSAANSAVCFALGVTSVDPARTALLFERFLSKERGEPPDIDVDFEHERREEVIQYVYERYGRERAGMVNEVISYRGRSSVRDVGKVFGLSLDQVDRLATALDRWAAGDGVPEDALVREAGLDPAAPEVRQTLEVAARFAGLPRHLSIHVGGFIVSDEPLIDLVPIEPASMEARTVVQWDKYDVDALDLVKVDLLALGMLTAIRKSFDLVAGFGGPQLTLATVPAEDSAVYDLFCRADTVGVFQIESRAQMSMLPRLRPRCFYDLVIEVAIVRPGPIQGGMVHPYLRRRTGEEPVTYAHPALVPILERTLGVPLFQEQVMAMAVAVGGFTPGQADQLRRAMGAWRKRGNLLEMGRKLVDGMVARGIDPAYAEAVFQQILGFGEYGFPESHAASFALLVYVSGWLRCHHLAAFTAGLVNSQPMGFYSPRALVADAQRHGVEVRPICVVASAWDCTLERRADGAAALRLGLRLVRGLGEDDGARLVAVRAERPFGSVIDVVHRTGLDRGALARLADAAAFSALEPDRRRVVWTLQGAWSDRPLFAGLQRREPVAALPAETPVDALRADYRATGLSVDRHPVALCRPGLRRKGARTIAAVLGSAPGSRVRTGGLVSSRQRPGTASGVVFMTLEDETGMLNLVVWPKVWARFRVLARNANLLCVDGEVQRQDDAASVLVARFWEMPEPEGGWEEPIDLRSRDFH
jgi:error-prone DNA polymerase